MVKNTNIQCQICSKVIRRYNFKRHLRLNPNFQKIKKNTLEQKNNKAEFHNSITKIKAKSENININLTDSEKKSAQLLEQRFEIKKV